MEANDEMVEGYRDGLTDDRLDMPASNRSASYQHGWLNGRDDRVGTPRASAAELRERADQAMAADR